MFKTVLFPLNRSQETRQAVDIAIELIQKYQADLYVLSVAEADSDRQPSQDLIQEVQSYFSEAGIAVKTKVAEGKAAFVICDFADEINADLIIMGSRGVSLSEEHPDDSVSQKVINLSPCPVLVVP
ncbi:universal stress protein [Pseudanabaena mucicola]|uniref:Universal stress protein n=1 Tax=Pseudanabaena mucicola FACHB-723 TaxID=2692860 RepID=A0ABR7ZZ11_9CYAN|nr:universal stress protein [Pseudanabaena mucicola]MBD2189079.1 universal stress protein [Pseudanabaena mucicola FACHB-723]